TENYWAIRRELEEYNPQLKTRPEIIVVTKSELPPAQDVAATLGSETKNDVFLISAVTGDGLPRLMNRIDQVLEQHSSCD
ncbi:GTPase ObgE, partial [Mariniblastus sp.]|nr:GTPase ObgE [Mariniblastus sp.]